jgi:hypothetical protein
MTYRSASNETRTVPPDRPTDREVVPGSMEAQTRDWYLENTVSSTVYLSSAKSNEQTKTK